MSEMEPRAMSADVGMILKKIVRDYTPEIVRETERCVNLLEDLCRDAPKERKLLAQVVREHLAERLLDGAKSSGSENVLIAQCVHHLTEDCGLKEERAQWAVETWAEALGIAVVRAAPMPTAPIDMAPSVPIVPASRPRVPLNAPAPRTQGHGTAPSALNLPAPKSIRTMPVRTLQLELGRGITMEMLCVPAGKFIMGSPDEEEERVANCELAHQVEITRPFFLAKAPVTVGQFRRFVEDTQYKTDAEKGDGGNVWNNGVFEKKRDASWSNPYVAQTDAHPVVLVSWNDAHAFARWLTNRDRHDIHLPTEAQWEYACRADTQTPFFFGATIRADQANYDGREKYANGVSGVYRKQTTPVGTFKANAWGLFDMHGNVWEWCWDGFRRDYEKLPTKEPLELTDRSSGARVIRGGAWNWKPHYCRSACRGMKAPSERTNVWGFRCAAVAAE